MILCCWMSRCMILLECSHSSPRSTSSRVLLIRDTRKIDALASWGDSQRFLFFGRVEQAGEKFTGFERPDHSLSKILIVGYDPLGNWSSAGRTDIFEEDFGLRRSTKYRFLRWPLRLDLLDNLPRHPDFRHNRMLRVSEPTLHRSRGQGPEDGAYFPTARPASCMSEQRRE